MDTDRILSSIENDPSYAGQIVAWRRSPAQPGRFSAPDPPLPPALAACLGSQDVAALYEHQAEALAAARRGQHLVIETPTASGKSLCFNLPVLEGLAADPKARALYLFPVKALARDQLAKLDALAPDLAKGVYDGDTPRAERQRLRHEARLLLTNPDLLHLGILPYHLQWAEFFANLRYVVIDEVHAYRGAFGTNVAHVLRRLRRLAGIHGGTPQFIMASATIANPAEHGEALTGLPVNLIRGSGAPRGPRLFLLWDAYRPGRSRRGLTASAYLEDATWLLALLLREGTRTILFTRSRQVTEWILVYLTRILEGAGRSDLLGRVRSYRGGYLPSERRAIERQLFTGELLGVISTSALELGVDIGGLEAAVIVGYPGTMASLWQQAGRAGRNADPSLGVFIPGPGVLERYYLSHAEYFFDRPTEQALIDPGNPYLLLDQLGAAAFEWPLGGEDKALWGEMGLGLAGLMAEEGMLNRGQEDKRWYFAGQEYPAARISLRGGSGDYSLSSGGAIIGTIPAESAFRQIHPGAVYLHAGQSYLSESLDITARTARLTPVETDYYTEATEEVAVKVIEEYQHTALGRLVVSLGEVQVTTRVVGYRRRQAGSSVSLGSAPLDLPAQDLPTIGMWLIFPEALAERLAAAGRDPGGGLHGLEHLLIGLLPLVVLCDRWDAGGNSSLHPPDLAGPAVFIYDGVRGGFGLAERIFLRFAEFLPKAQEALADCGCTDGCPSCIISPKCGSHNQPLDKRATKEILAWMQNEIRSVKC